MLKPAFQSMILFGLACAPGVALAATEYNSEIFIGTATQLQGNNGSGPRMTFFSQRMVLPLLYAGTVSSLQTASLTDTNANWSLGEFGATGTQAYVEFTNGWMADIANSTTPTNLTLADNLTGVASIGDTYRIRAHFTIASLFGTNNETGLVPGINPTVADNIIVQIPQTQQTLTIFYFTNGATHGWRLANFTSANNLVVYPEEGLMVRRLYAGDQNLYLCGPIKTDLTEAPVATGYNLVGTLKSLSAMSLAALNLYTGDATTGLVGGLNPTVSDNLLVVQPDGSSTTYFYFTGNPAGWRTATYIPADSTLIQPGGAFFIHRLNNNGAFNWVIPAE